MAKSATAEVVEMVSAAKLADIFGCSVVYVGKLTKDGIIPRAAKGQYPKDECCKKYIAHLKSEERRSTKSAGENRFRDARTLEIEQRMAERRRELVHVDDFDAAVSNVLGFIREALDGKPARITRDLELRRKIEHEIDDALTQAALRSAAVDKSLRAGLDPSEAVHQRTAG